MKIKQVIFDNINLINFDKYSRVVLITGLNSYKQLRVFEEITSKLSKKKLIHFKKGGSPTRKSFLIDVSTKMQLNNFDCLIALGGGNVIDFSKGLKYFSNKNKIDLLSIPTTCGSGSESTNFFVCYENNLKISLLSKDILPKFVILDHNNLKGLSKMNLVSSYLDAFSQGIESFWSINSTIKSKDYSLLALSHLIKAKENILSFDKTCLINAQLGAHYAGKAINISKTSAPHAFSYFFNKYEIPHGIAVNITTLFFLNEVYSKSDSKLKLQLDQMSIKLINKDFSHFIIYYEHLLKFLGDYSKYLFKSISNFDYSNLIDSVNLERLKNTPVEVDFNGLIKYLKSL